jgi:hypothetical protein
MVVELASTVSPRPGLGASMARDAAKPMTKRRLLMFGLIESPPHCSEWVPLQKDRPSAGRCPRATEETALVAGETGRIAADPSTHDPCID